MKENINIQNGEKLNHNRKVRSPPYFIQIGEIKDLGREDRIKERFGLERESN